MDPTTFPSTSPSVKPKTPTELPTFEPTNLPTVIPSDIPTIIPTRVPTIPPTLAPAPLMINAIFDLLGLTIEVSFDSDTDRGQLKGTFKCDELFEEAWKFGNSE